MCGTVYLFEGDPALDLAHDLLDLGLTEGPLVLGRDLGAHGQAGQLFILNKMEKRTHY